MIVYGKDCPKEILENGVSRQVKGWLDELMLVELAWQKGMTGAVHSHPHVQCGYVVKGSFEAEIDGNKTVLSQGDCFYAKSGQPHGLTALEDGSVFLDVFTPKREDFINQ